MTTSPDRADETPVYALIAPDGDLTWHPLKDEPAVQKTIGGSYGPGCTTTASVDYPALRLVANDIAALDASGEFLPNPAAEHIITACRAAASPSHGAATSPWSSTTSTPAPAKPASPPR
jgi:hypothetical protein